MTIRAMLSIALLCIALAPDARAAGERAVPVIEASMLVKGRIHVDPQGNVERFELDGREALPESVVGLLDRAIPAWRFEPTVHDGVPAHVDTSMRVRVAANMQADESILLRIAGASFGDPVRLEDLSDAARASRRRHVPYYPHDALRTGAMATVHVLVKVGHDGKVQDAMAEQVNLRFRGTERTMDSYRKAFATSALRAAKRWTLDVPADVGPDETWVARIPVDYTINNFRMPGYGEWDRYVPGPRQVAPWSEEAPGTTGDTYASGGIYPVGGGLKLLTPLQASG